MKIKFLLMLTMFCTSIITNEAVQNLKHCLENITREFGSPAVSTRTLRNSHYHLKESIPLVEKINTDLLAMAHQTQELALLFAAEKQGMTDDQSQYLKQKFSETQSMLKTNERVISPLLENARSLVKKIEDELFAREVTPIALLTLAKTPTS